MSIRQDNLDVSYGKAWLQKLVNSTNFADMDSLRYFQNFLKKRGVVDELKKIGIEDGDTVKILDFEFEFYD